MPKAIVISEKEYTEIVKLRKANKDKNIERRLHVPVLRYRGMSYNEMAKITGYNSQYAQLPVCTYRKQGLSDYAKKSRQVTAVICPMKTSSEFRTSVQQKPRKGKFFQHRMCAKGLRRFGAKSIVKPCV